MAKVDKEKVLELRAQGYGYKKIAKELSVSISSIRYLCEQMNKEEQIVQIGECKECGDRIISQKGKKKKQFCCDECRMRWWNSHLDLVKRKANYKITCQNCGKEFIVYGNAKRKYCCRECYTKGRIKEKVNCLKG